MRLSVPPPHVAMGLLLGAIGIFAPPHTASLLAACGLGLGVALLFPQKSAQRDQPNPLPGPDRRRAPRVQPDNEELSAAVLVNGAWVPAAVIDLSTGGARLRLPDRAAAPAALTLSVCIDGQTLPARGQLRWEGVEGEHRLIGLAFDVDQPALAGAIGAWIRERVARQALPQPIRLAG